uniref:Immunoglobulin V-set domain-containing protein n=1 Tax=Gopherus evgoodei TaxID=1825980 RepID=A0A8C4WT64_9SAUR
TWSCCSSCLCAKGRLVEQSPPYFMVRTEVSQSVTCTLKNTTYLWMSWYQQDVQGHLHFLVQSGTKGDQEKIIQEGTSYRSERVSSTELSLEMQNVTQSQTIYCTCGKGTIFGGFFGLGQQIT